MRAGRCMAWMTLGIVKVLPVRYSEKEPDRALGLCAVTRSRSPWFIAGRLILDKTTRIGGRPSTCRVSTALGANERPVLSRRSFCAKFAAASATVHPKGPRVTCLIVSMVGNID